MIDAPEQGASEQSLVQESPLPEQGGAQPSGHVRDEQGRFASQQAEQGQPGQPAPSTEGQPQTPPEGFVPQQALHAARQSERELKAQLETSQRQMMEFMTRFQPQQPAPTPQAAPDFYDDPDKAIDHRVRQAVDPLQNGQQAIVERFSKMMATKDYGQEVVNTAYSDLQNRVRQFGPQDYVYQRIMHAEHPYGELVEWHKEQSALTKVGKDPEAYINAEVERRLAERGAAPLQQQPPGQQPPTSQTPPLPQSFANGRNNGPRSTPGFSGPRPLSEIMGGR